MEFLSCLLLMCNIFMIMTTDSMNITLQFSQPCSKLAAIQSMNLKFLETHCGLFTAVYSWFMQFNGEISELNAKIKTVTKLWPTTNICNHGTCDLTDFPTSLEMILQYATITTSEITCSSCSYLTAIAGSISISGGARAGMATNSRLGSPVSLRASHRNGFSKL